jgi:hypothetical protein
MLDYRSGINHSVIPSQRRIVMKKLIYVLFAIGLVIGSLSACGYGQTKKSECPNWAVPTYGLFCQSDSQEVTDWGTPVSLNTWKIGQIMLNAAWIDNVYGVEFYSKDGTKVLDTRQMEQGVWYSFKVTEESGAFRVYFTSDHNPLTAATKLLIAKP